MKDKTYYFHQTPVPLAVELMKHIEVEEKDTLFEPFKGEGAFYNAFPSNTINIFTEKEEGSDYRDYDDLTFDWVISNPPFRLEEGGKRENAFFKILDYFAGKVNKGIAFLGNDYCLATLTPKRLKVLNDKGLYIHNIVVCNVKAWRGRYFFIIFKKQVNNTFKFLEGIF
jgi:hypothetical protein